MVQTDAKVIALDSLGPLVRVVLDSPEVTTQISPGRFVLADLGGYLRTVLFPAVLDAPRDEPTAERGSPVSEMEVLVPPAHPLAGTRPGEQVNMVGPFGRGYAVAPEVTRLLLVADTPHLPVLLPVALAALGRGSNVTLVLASNGAADLFPIRLLPPALEVYTATADGSAGRPGTALDPFSELTRWASCICLAHEPAGYPAFADIVRQVRLGPSRRFAQALVVPAIACGVGACQGCAVETVRGPRRACTDGPVFDLLELQ